jgi:hypothetical protein
MGAAFHLSLGEVVILVLGVTWLAVAPRTADAWPTADAAPAPSSHDETTTQPEASEHRGHAMNCHRIQSPARSGSANATVAYGELAP